MSLLNHPNPRNGEDDSQSAPAAVPGGDRQTIAERLRAAREQAGLSQGQVAAMMNLHRPSISEVEAARRRVSAEELAKFAEIYDVSTSWLTKGESEVPDPALELAARELGKLKKEDLDRVLKLLRTLRKNDF